MIRTFSLLLALIISPLFAQDIPVHDIGRIYEVQAQIAFPSNEDEICQIVREANRTGRPIVPAGKKHSQGGHALLHGGTVVDMSRLNRTLSIDTQHKTILVQAGVTWEQIQEAANPHGLAVSVMQSSNIFTVGGSLSVNAHGRDPRYSTLIESVKRIKMLLADGTIRWVSRDQDSELFHLAIGGYGLFGIILEAELYLTTNDVYAKASDLVSPEDYPSYFQERVLTNPNAGLHFARFSLGKGQTMTQLIAVTHAKTESRMRSLFPLKSEKNIILNKALLNSLRKTDLAKSALWNLEVWEESIARVSTRNNAMRPPILCLDYDSPKDTDILQEYFIPVDQFALFTSKARDIVEKRSVNLMNVTIRYLKKDSEAFLSYAKEDCFSFVFYINHGLSLQAVEEAKSWTQELVNAALECHGTYYLPYQRYPTLEQLKTAYPEIERFFEKKKAYDPNNIFQNEFYRDYQSRFNTIKLEGISKPHR